MADKRKTRAQLTAELTQLRERIAELETAQVAHQQVAEALRDSQQRLADIIDFLPDATLAIDREKRVIIWNKAMEDMTGVPAAEMIGRGDYAYTIPFYGEARPQLMDLVLVDQAELAARYPTIMRAGDTLLAEVFCNALYGHRGAWVTAKASPLHDQAGNIIGAIESIHDITARKQAESQRAAALEALRESQQQLSHITDNIPIIITYVNAQDFRFKFVNRTYANAFGMQPQDLIGKQLEDILPRSTYERSLPYFERVRAGERVHYENKTVVPVSGEPRWLSIDYMPELDEQGMVQNILALGYDITARKQAEEALRESEEKYRRLVDNANEAILVTQDGWLKFVNRMTLDLTGYSEQELLSTPFTGFIHPADQSLVLEHHLKRLQGDTSESKYEFRLITRDGRTKWVDIGTVLIEWAGQPAALSFLSDITARKQAEEALIASESRYRRLFETAKDGILILDADTGRITDVNPFLIELLGCSRAACLNKEIWKLGPFKDAAASQVNFQELQQQGYIRYEDLPLETADGRQIDVEFISNVYRVDHHKVIQCNIRDITARKRAESQREAALGALRETNAELQTRNEELDAFAHTVAHDLTNLLGAMMGYGELLAETYDALSAEMIQLTLNSINRIGRKAGSIIESLLMLASVRKQDVRVAPLDMARIVDEAVLRLAGAIQESGAEINVPDRARWPVALGHAPWIEEIWANYLSNAIKYGGEHPRIELDAARLPPSSAGEGRGGGFIRFSVRDYGPGLTPEQQARLFVPFERLGQAQIKGHGLGLSVVRRIAEKLGGQVGVDSAPDQGSTFYFTLPAAREG